jgi:uncharacterized membrane protein/uncharacterized membrane protein YeaQ/YmgE (transglycosylase-associated protein family)
MLQLLTWTATGLVAGGLARIVMRSRRDFGLLGDLLTGWFGALVGGWVFRRIEVTTPETTAGRILVSLVGACVLLAGVRLLRQIMPAAQSAVAGNISVPAANLTDHLLHLGNFERTILSRLLNRERWSRDPNVAFDAQATFGERLADRVASFGGSWTFIGIFAIFMVSWMALNEDMTRPFDPYPYILLNLMLSCLAALQAPVIMMSQNRQAARDRSDAKTDYEVNVRAEMEITAVHAKLDLLREQEWLRLLVMLEEQKQALERIDARLGSLESGTGRG